MAILVRQYGCLPPLDWGDDCHEQLWLQNKFWNRLVEIDHEFQERQRSVTSADTSVAEKEEEMRGLVERKAEAHQEASRLRAEARSKKIDTSIFDRTIKDCAAKIKEVKVELKGLRAAAREKSAPVLAAIEAERKEAVKSARNGAGIWWGNYNAVAAAYDVARIRAMKEGVRLKFHRFDGSGRFTCQIQGGMSVAELFGGAATVGITPLPENAFVHSSKGERRRLQRSTLTFTIYTYRDDAGKRQRRTLSLPMVMHRPIPEKAVVKQITLKREKIGTEFRWSVTFTCTIKDEVIQHVGNNVCGIDIGWRNLGEGGVRIATVAGTEGTLEHIVLPAEMIEAFDHVDKLKSKLDQKINETHLWLKSLTFTELPESLREEWERIRKAPKIGAGKLARLAIQWREHPDRIPAHAEKLEQWRRGDKKFRLEMDNLRNKVIGRRTDIYRNAALKIAHVYALIGIEDFDLRQVARIKTDDGQENELHQAARKMRQRVAVSDFRNWLDIQAQKTGSELIQVKGKTSLVHYMCGSEMKPDRLEVKWYCSACDKWIDQDENAAKNIRMAAAGMPASDQVKLKTA